MTPMKTPWPGLEYVVQRLGKNWVETRFATWLLLKQMPELEADPSDENWDRIIPLQQYLFTVGLDFELAAQQFLASGDELAKLVMPAVDEMRRTLVAETEWSESVSYWSSCHDPYRSAP